MLRSIPVEDIFDMNKALNSNDPLPYWLAQLRKQDWLCLLNFVGEKMPIRTKKQILAETALSHFEFELCEGRGEVWQLWNEVRNDHRALLIQFRHSESDWTHGAPEFVDLGKNEPLGFVNIAGRLFCRVK